MIPPGTIFVHTRDGHPSTPSQPFSIGHTGFVIEDLGTQYRTIEGNASDSVRSNVRDKGAVELVGFLTWW